MMIYIPTNFLIQIVDENKALFFYNCVFLKHSSEKGFLDCKGLPIRPMIKNH